MLNYFQELARYQEWADAQFFWRWRQFQGAQKDQEILKLATHIVTVQKLFAEILENQQAALPDRDAPLPAVSELEAICRKNHARLSRYLSETSTESLSNLVTVPWFSPEIRLTAADAILQVLFHTQHHRGQVLQMLSRYAEKAMIIDYIAWIYKGRPAARWQ